MEEIAATEANDTQNMQFAHNIQRFCSILFGRGISSLALGRSYKCQLSNPEGYGLNQNTRPQSAKRLYISCDVVYIQP